MQDAEVHFIDLHRSWGALYSFALHNPKQFVGLHRSLQKLLQGREAWLHIPVLALVLVLVLVLALVHHHYVQELLSRLTIA